MHIVERKLDRESERNDVEAGFPNILKLYFPPFFASVKELFEYVHINTSFAGWEWAKKRQQNQNNNNNNLFLSITISHDFHVLIDATIFS